jgi:hypothetical protein
MSNSGWMEQKNVSEIGELFKLKHQKDQIISTPPVHFSTCSLI